jgi:hypothetical protein
MAKYAKEASIVDKEMDYASIVLTGIGLMKRY